MPKGLIGKCALCLEPVNDQVEIIDVTVALKDCEVYVDICAKCVSTLWWSLDKASRLRRQDTDLDA